MIRAASSRCGLSGICLKGSHGGWQTCQNQEPTLFRPVSGFVPRLLNCNFVGEGGTIIFNNQAAYDRPNLETWFKRNSPIYEKRTDCGNTTEHAVGEN
jgi:hypothetical protein